MKQRKSTLRLRISSKLSSFSALLCSLHWHVGKQSARKILVTEEERGRSNEPEKPPTQWSPEIIESWLQWNGNEQIMTAYTNKPSVFRIILELCEDMWITLLQKDIFKDWKGGQGRATGMTLRTASGMMMLCPFSAPFWKRNESSSWLQSPSPSHCPEAGCRRS